MQGRDRNNRVQRSSDSWCLKLVREISVSSFRDFCSSFQSLAAENWKERRPKEEFVLVVTEIYLLRDIPAGARATGGCCYGDQRAEIRGECLLPCLFQFQSF